MVRELMAEEDKYDVPLRWGFGGPIIGTARIDPEEFPEGVIEAQISDETYKSMFQPNVIDLSIYGENVTPKKEDND